MKKVERGFRSRFTIIYGKTGVANFLADHIVSREKEHFTFHGKTTAKTPNHGSVKFSLKYYQKRSKETLLAVSEFYRSIQTFYKVSPPLGQRHSSS